MESRIRSEDDDDDDDDWL